MMQTKPAGYFLSDLHLFARRSRAERHVDSIRSAAESARLIVFGGDMFDFRWSTLPSVPATIDASLRWLDDIVSAHRHCQFEFVLGNHDWHADFVRRLDEFAYRQENLGWHPYHVRIGAGMYLHGDVTDGPADEASLARRRARKQDDHRRKGPLANHLYDAAIRARVHKMVSSVAHRPQFVVRRVHRYVRNVGHGAETGLRHVYFGHTHAAMSDVIYRGLAFHNGGAPIDGLDFRIVPIHPEAMDAGDAKSVA